MLKIFYYPAYFRLKRWGPTSALAISTLFVFLVTWFLHAYQWFWLRGSFLLAWQDGLFWAILAVLVVINALWENAHGRVRRLSSRRTWGASTGLAARTAGTFAVICLLWSLWTSESVTAWFGLWASLVDWKVDVSLLSVVLMSAVVVGGMTGTPAAAAEMCDAPAWRQLWRSLPRTIVSLILLVLLGIPAVYTRLGADVATVINSLRSGRLSRVDTALLERGYYEDLLSVDRFNSELWRVYMNKPLNWLDVEGSGLERFTGDFKQKELVPSFTSLTPHGRLSTNRWGMRDRDYEQVPPPGTYRIALLGASTVMGWGVADDETFDAILEGRLNSEAAGLHARYEVLNFGTPGYRPLQQMMVLPKALSFGPHAVFYIGAGREVSQASLALVDAVRKGIDIPFQYLRDTALRAGIDRSTEEGAAMRRLEPFRGEILSWLYGQIVQRSRERGIVPVFVFLPQVDEGTWREEVSEVLRRAGDAGFTVIDLSRVYEGHSATSVRLADWDNHPNARGHQLIGSQLYEALRKRQDAILSRHAAGARS
jgi:hypothetical protein